MKKKLILGLAIVIVLAIGTYSYKFYKDYQDFHTFRELLDEGYLPVLKETSAYLDEMGNFTNDLELSDWQVNKGLDKNLELRNRLEEAQLKISQRNVEYENTSNLKQNVLETIPTLQRILEESYTEGINDDVTQDMKILSLQVDEMNKILEKH